MDKANDTITNVPVSNMAIRAITSPDQIWAVTWQNLYFIKPEWLIDDGLIYSLKLFVLDVTDEADPVNASLCFNFLFELMKKNPKLASERPDTFRECLRMLSGLKATFLLTMPMGDILAFLSENLLYTLEVPDFDVSEKIQKLLTLSRNFPEVFESERKQYVHAIEESKEILGIQGLTFSDKTSEQEPTVQNWLIDYNQFSVSFMQPVPNIAKSSKKILGGSMERVAYLQRSNNVKNLSKDEKTILFNLLELYDWLKTVKPTSDFSPVFSNYTQTENFELPEEILEPEQKQEALKEPSSYAKASGDLRPPIVPTPKNAPTMRAMEEIQKAGIKNYEFGIKEDQDIGNKKTAPFGAALGSQLVPESPALTSKNSIAENQKTAQLRAVSQGLNLVTDSPNLTLNNSISKFNNLSSGGGKGNRTPETQVSSSGSSPDYPQPQTSYQNSQNFNRVNPVESSFGGSAPQTFNRVNIQDILNKRESDLGTGLRNFPTTGQGNQNVGSRKSEVGSGDTKNSVSAIPPAEHLKSSTGQANALSAQTSKQTDIEKKLEELRKKVDKK